MTTGDARLHPDRQSADAPVLSPKSPRTTLLLRVGANLVGACGALLFARAGLEHYLRTHSLIGGLFFAEQLWIVVAFVVRRPASIVSQRPGDWLLAFGGTFGGVLFRPDGAHLPGWIAAGLGLQLTGLALCVTSFFALGRSFGFAPAYRGLSRRGPYAIVRHPIYTSLLAILASTLFLLTPWRCAVLSLALFIVGTEIRVYTEDRLLASRFGERFSEYRKRVPAYLPFVR